MEHESASSPVFASARQLLRSEFVAAEEADPELIAAMEDDINQAEQHLADEAAAIARRKREADEAAVKHEEALKEEAARRKRHHEAEVERQRVREEVRLRVEAEQADKDIRRAIAADAERTRLQLRHGQQPTRAQPSPGAPFERGQHVLAQVFQAA